MTVQRIPAWNYFDYVPVVSIASGSVRTVFGLAETVVGAVALPFQLMMRTPSQKTPLWVVDGVANIVRGTIALTPVHGNVLLYIYDHTQICKKDFQQAAGLLFE